MEDEDIFLHLSNGHLVRHALSFVFCVRAEREKLHRQMEKLQEGAVLGQEPSPSNKRASLGMAKMCHHLWRTRMPTSPALQPAGSL